MNEASCKLIGPFIVAAEKRGVSLGALAEGTGCDQARLRDKHEWIDWAAYRQFMANVGRHWSTAELEAMGRRLPGSAAFRAISVVSRLFISATGIYEWMFAGRGRSSLQVLSCVEPKLQLVAEQRLELQVEMLQGFPPCPEFLWVTKGNLEAIPTMLGLPLARVEMDLNPNGARYRIEVPRGGQLLSRIKKAALYPFTVRAAAQELKEANEVLRRRYGELETARSQLARNADQLLAINEAGKELSRHTELSALGDAVSEMLSIRFGATGMRLWLARNPGDPLVIVRETGDREGPKRSWDLTSGGDRLGRIEAWRFDDQSSGLFDGLVPWIAIALNNARSFAMVKRAQSELEQRVQERTRELSQTTAKLSQTIRQLTEIDEQKTQFFANASHELRTPLTLMLLPVESLLSSAGLVVESREKLDGVLRGGYQLLKLINDLLDLSKVEAGKMQLRMGTVDLARLLEEVVRPWHPVLERRRIALELKLPAQLPTVADGERLEQVVLNLVSNAVKHVPDGGTLGIGAAQDDWVRFWVENSGEGIDPSEVDHVFERFGQSSKAKGRRFGTTGLGLPLVKELVELHSGAIVLQNEPGKRVRFEVKLPILQAREASREPAQRPSRTELRQYEVVGEIPRPPPEVPEIDTEALADRPLLLLVEDNADLRTFLGQALGDEYQVIQAGDGAAGLKLAREKHPDIVLSDLMMPEMDGMDLCRALKADPRTSGAPFLLLTARGDLNTKLEGLDTGADDFLVKPFHLNEVQSRLRTQLRIRRMSDQLAHAEKLVALGTVVAGVAHEVRNPLNGIINALIPVKEMVGSSLPEVAELVELALGAARRVELLTLRLLQQVRAGEAAQTDVDVQENVSLAIQLLQHKAASGPRLLTDFPGRITPPRVFGDPSSLNQIWVNLIDNAIQAAGKSGTVKVGVRSEGEQVVVEVSDDGPGIQSPLLKRIFDPFFTTKGVGEGTGLGLAVVRQVVNRHGGQVSVQSSPGAGAKFIVTLPSAAARLGAVHASG